MVVMDGRNVSDFISGFWVSDLKFDISLLNKTGKDKVKRRKIKVKSKDETITAIFIKVDQRWSDAFQPWSQTLTNLIKVYVTYSH